MKKISKFITMILCGISTISLFPGKNPVNLTDDPNVLMNQAWEKTGHVLMDTISKGTKNGKFATK